MLTLVVVLVFINIMEKQIKEPKSEPDPEQCVPKNNFKSTTTPISVMLIYAKPKIPEEIKDEGPDFNSNKVEEVIN
jgi:hypothetical protein